MRIISASFWGFVWLVFSVLALVALYDACPGGNAAFFYEGLMATGIRGVAASVTHSAAVLLTFLAILPFAGFLGRMRILSPEFWAWLLWPRIAADLFGRIYELMILKSVVSQNMSSAALILAWVGGIFALSYYTHIRYALSGKS